MSLGSSGLNIGPGAGTSGLGTSGLNGTFGSVLKTLQVDPNCILIQDPSAVWGVQDFLPRRNLLTQSSSPAVSPWSNVGVASTTSGQSDPWGGVTATLVTFGSTGGQGIRNYPTWSGGSYKVKFIVKKSAVCDWYRLLMFATSGTSYFQSWFNLSTGAVGSSSVGGAGVFAVATCTGLGTDWYEIVISGTIPVGDAASFVGIYPANADNSNTTVNNAALLFAGAQLTRADTIDQSYQKITDWTTEQYAWAAARQVPWLRRNTLASCVPSVASGWTKDANLTISTSTGETLDPFGGNTASKLTDAAANARFATFKASVTQEVGVEYTIIALLKDESRRYAFVCFSTGTSNGGVVADLQGGSITKTFQSGDFTYVSSSISSLSNGWYEVRVVLLRSGSTNVLACSAHVALCDVPTPSQFWNYTYIGNGSSIYCGGVTYLVGNSGTYQHLAGTWDATYTALAAAAGFNTGIWQDAGTNPVNTPGQTVYRLADSSGKGYTANQATAANRPIWTSDANGKPYILGDQVNDAMPVTFPASFSSNASVYVTTDAGTTVTDSVTLNGSYAPLVAAKQYARVVFKSGRPTYHEKLIRWLNAKAGL